MTSLFSRHSGDQKINGKFTTLELYGDKTSTTIPTQNTLYVKGGTYIDGDFTTTGTVTLASLELSNLTFTDGNEQNGYVMTSNDTGVISLKPKHWNTNDNPELASGPSDNIIWTNENVVIGTTTTSELFEVNTDTSGEGALIGNMKVGNWLSDTTSGILVNDSIKNEATSYGLKLKSDGQTDLNSKTEINFNILDIQAGKVDSSGNFGIGISTPTANLHVGGDVIVEGDFTVNGTLTSIESTNLEIEDPLIKVAKENTTDLIDFGYYGRFNDGSNKYAGIYRDASSANKEFVLFSEVSTEPTTTVDDSRTLGTLLLDTINVDNSIEYSSSLNFNNGTEPKIFINNDGNLGIGVTTPVNPLQVSGNSYFDGNLGIGISGQDISLYVNNTDAIKLPTGDTAQRPSSPVEGYIRFNNETTDMELYNGIVWAALTTSTGNDTIIDPDGDTLVTVGFLADEDKIRFITVDALRMIIDDSGLIGIGTSTPVYQVDVVGDINIDSSSAYKINGTDVLLGTTLGSTIVNSSLTSVGNLTDLTVVGDLAVDTNVLYVDTGNDRVGINNISPTQALDVVGNALINGSADLSDGNSYQIDSNIVLNENSLGTGVTSSNLQQLGTLNSLDISGNLTVDTDVLVVDTGNNRVGINNSSPAEALDITGNGNLTGNLVVGGDLTVNGTTTTINSSTVTVEDPLIKLADNNSTDAVDIGHYGLYNDGTTKFSGIFRDASDNIHKIFTDLEVEPTSTVNTGATGYTKGDLLIKDLRHTDLIFQDSESNVRNSSSTIIAKYTSGGFYGIGTGTPSYPLHVTTVNAASWSARFVNGNSDILIGNQNTNGISINSGASDSSTSYILNARNNDTNNIFYVRNDSKVGILTSSPDNLFHVNTGVSGEGIRSGSAFIGNGNTPSTDSVFSHNDFKSSLNTDYAIKQVSTGDTYLNIASSGSFLRISSSDSTLSNFNTSGYLKLGAATSATEPLDVNGNAIISDDLTVNTTTLKVDSTNSRVGINTASPGFTLDVNGNSNITGTMNLTTGNDYQINSTSVLSNNTLGSGVVNSSLTSNTGNLTNTGTMNLTTGNDYQINSTSVLTNDTLGSGVINSSLTNLGILTVLEVSGNATITGDVVITGDLNYGSLSVETIEIEDPLIKVGHNNVADIVDIGIYGQYNDGTDKYAGLFRDASDEKFKLFKELQVEPGDTVNTAGTGYAAGDLLLDTLEATDIVVDTSLLNTNSTNNTVSVGSLSSNTDYSLQVYSKKTLIDNQLDISYSGGFATLGFIDVNGDEVFRLLADVDTNYNLNYRKDLGTVTGSYMYVDNNMLVGFNNISPSYQVDVVGDVNIDSSSSYKINGTDVLVGTTLGSTIVNSSLTSVGTLDELTVTNDINVSGDIYAQEFITTSDKRIKENIRDTNEKNILEKLMKLKTYNYNIIGKERLEYGLIAQEVEKLFPNIISESKRKIGNIEIENFKGINTYGLNIYMLEAIKELNSKVDFYKNINYLLIIFNIILIFFYLI